MLKKFTEGLVFGLGFTISFVAIWYIATYSLYPMLISSVTQTVIQKFPQSSNSIPTKQDHKDAKNRPSKSSNELSADGNTPRFGITTIHDNAPACVTFQGQELQTGQKVNIATFDPPRWHEGKVINKRLKRCETFDDLDGIAYDVTLDTTDDIFYGGGVTVVADISKKLIVNGRPAFSLSRENKDIEIQECTTSETVHYFAWQDHRSVWYDYEPLGYDAEPTCTGDEFSNLPANRK
ncbi:MAG: hypothetical protein OEV26_01785 [Gallionella sp.]|nr:hypothetical protein [Gallionella sp.]